MMVLVMSVIIVYMPTILIKQMQIMTILEIIVMKILMVMALVSAKLRPIICDHTCICINNPYGTFFEILYFHGVQHTLSMQVYHGVW